MPAALGAAAARPLCPAEIPLLRPTCPLHGEEGGRKACATLHPSRVSEQVRVHLLCPVGRGAAFTTWPLLAGCAAGSQCPGSARAGWVEGAVSCPSQKGVLTVTPLPFLEVQGRVPGTSGLFREPQHWGHLLGHDWVLCPQGLS